MGEKKGKIEKNLIQRAKSRWKALREKLEYKKDFDKFIEDDRFGIKNDPNYRSLYFDNFPMFPEEKLSDFKDRIIEELEKKKCILAEGEGDLYGYDEDEGYIFEICDSELTDKWKINPLVDSRVTDPNPWALESLTFDPVCELGNISFVSFPALSNVNDFKNMLGINIKDIDEKYDDWNRTKLYMVTKIFYDFDKGPYLHETKKIILEIDLEQKIKDIKHSFDKIISREITRLKQEDLLKDKRETKVQDRQIKTYRYRKQGKLFREIAKETHPDKFRWSQEKALVSAFDDFKAGFKLIRGRNYNPIEDLEEFKEFPVIANCKDCENKNFAKYSKCIKRFSLDGEWKPLCPQIALSLKHGQKKNLREDIKEIEKLEELDGLYKAGKRLYKPGRQKT